MKELSRRKFIELGGYVSLAALAGCKLSSPTAPELEQPEEKKELPGPRMTFPIVYGLSAEQDENDKTNVNLDIILIQNDPANKFLYSIDFGDQSGIKTGTFENKSMEEGVKSIVLGTIKHSYGGPGTYKISTQLKRDNSVSQNPYHITFELK